MELEKARAENKIGSALEAKVVLKLAPSDYELAQKLEEELKFVLIVSKVLLEQGDSLEIKVEVASGEKCSRCWHHLDEVGNNPNHPSLCERCVSNVEGNGEERKFC